MQWCSEVLDVRDGISVRCGEVVEGTIITAGTPCSWFLGHHMQWWSPDTGGRLDDTKLKKIVELLLSSSQLFRGKSTNLCEGWSASSYNAVLDTMYWCLLSHLRSSELGEVSENGVMLIVCHRKIVEVECFQVRKVSRNASAGCFWVIQSVVLEVNEQSVLTEKICTNNWLADIIAALRRSPFLSVSRSIRVAGSTLTSAPESTK